MTRPSDASAPSSIDLLAVGEVLVDLIGTSTAEGLASTGSFERFQGGSPANLCRALALTGRRTALVGCVGQDGLGDFLKDELARHGVVTKYLARAPNAPTSAVLLSRSPGTADFVAYRHADTQIGREHLPPDALSHCRLYHTTCFALSRTPARTSILDGARAAAEHGAVLSLDANYAPRIWTDRSEAQTIVREYCTLEPIVKVSLDDIQRLFGEASAASDVIDRLHRWGARLVCLTRGPDGSLVSWHGGTQRAEVPTAPVDVVDATGAGDTFWAGFLHGWLAGRPPDACARAGTTLAARKLTQAGPLTDPLPDGFFAFDA